MYVLLVAQIPEAIYFSLFMIYTKRLKEKRLLYTALMVIAYEDVSEMATENSEKQKLMKMAEREKEHYRTAKEMLEKHM